MHVWWSCALHSDSSSDDATTEDSSSDNSNDDSDVDSSSNASASASDDSIATPPKQTKAVSPVKAAATITKKASPKRTKKTKPGTYTHIIDKIKVSANSAYATYSDYNLLALIAHTYIPASWYCGHCGQCCMPRCLWGHCILYWPHKLYAVMLHDTIPYTLYYTMYYHYCYDRITTYNSIATIIAQ